MQALFWETFQIFWGEGAGGKKPRIIQMAALHSQVPRYPKYEKSHTNTYTHTTVLWPSGFCPGLPGWAGTRKVKPVWIYWSKR